MKPAHARTIDAHARVSADLNFSDRGDFDDARRGFIGTLADEPQADRRGPGTIAVTLAAIAQGVQIHRVHDTQDARQALHLWRAVTKGALK